MSDTIDTAAAPWRQEYELRHSDLDFMGRLSAVGLARLLQEAAGHHADALKLSPEILRRDGLTWVLGQFRLRVLSRSPGWRARIRVETWRAGIERLFAARDFRAFTDSGECVAEATSYWALFNMASRRPAAFPPSIRENYPVEAERVPIGAEGYVRLPSPTRTDFQLEHRVRLSELDENDHVTNSAYLLWALDSIPDELARASATAELLPSLEMTFKAEALPGDTIVCRTQHEREGDEHLFLHLLVRASDGRECAIGRTRFRTRVQAT